MCNSVLSQSFRILCRHSCHSSSVKYTDICIISLSPLLCVSSLLATQRTSHVSFTYSNKCTQSSLNSEVYLNICVSCRICKKCQLNPLLTMSSHLYLRKILTEYKQIQILLSVFNLCFRNRVVPVLLSVCTGLLCFGFLTITKFHSTVINSPIFFATICGIACIPGVLIYSSVFAKIRDLSGQVSLQLMKYKPEVGCKAWKRKVKSLQLLSVYALDIVLKRDDPLDILNFGVYQTISLLIIL